MYILYRLRLKAFNIKRRGIWRRLNLGLVVLSSHQIHYNLFSMWAPSALISKWHLFSKFKKVEFKESFEMFCISLAIFAFKSSSVLDLSPVIVEATFSCLWIYSEICSSATFERCQLCVEWRHLVGNYIFCKLMFSSVYAKKKFEAFANSCVDLQILQKRMARKFFWRKLRTRPKLFFIM